MAAPIVFYFDFASPYAYVSLGRIAEIARRHGREVEWRPVILWAVFKALGIGAPLASAARWRYLQLDMVRSAAFHGVPYRHPPNLPVSTHLANRLYLAVERDDPVIARRLGLALFQAFMADGRDITDREVLAAVADEAGVPADHARAAMDGADGRALLAAAVARAVGDGVIGSPYFIVDGEPFFGADRLPQIEWRLSSRA